LPIRQNEGDNAFIDIGKALACSGKKEIRMEILKEGYEFDLEGDPGELGIADYKGRVHSRAKLLACGYDSTQKEALALVGDIEGDDNVCVLIGPPPKGDPSSDHAASEQKNVLPRLLGLEGQKHHGKRFDPPPPPSESTLKKRARRRKRFGSSPTKSPLRMR
jgi:hypothetical protein